MKRFIAFILLFCIAYLKCNAQHGIKVGFNDTHIGNSVSCLYTYDYKTMQFEVGFKYHIFDLAYDNQNNIIKDRVYPMSILKHFGPILGIRKSFPLNNTMFSPEVFIQSQYIYGGLHNTFYSPYISLENGMAITQDGRPLYTKEEVIFQEQHNLENILGIGFDIEIISWLNLYARTGIILGVYWDIDPRLITMTPSVTEFGIMFAIGLQFYI